MKLYTYIRTLSVKAYLLFFSITLLIILVFKFTVFKSDSFLIMFETIYKSYLLLIEDLANLIIKLTGSDVIIINHKIIFGHTSEYNTVNQEMIQNWANYILFKKWGIFLLTVFWFSLISFKKKIIYTFCFIFTHFISVLTGLIIITILGPALIDPKTLIMHSDGFYQQLPPNVFGVLAMFSLLVIWYKKNENEILQIFTKLNIKFKISDKKVNQVIVLLFMFFLLQNFIVPFIKFEDYISFLLHITKSVVSIFNYKADIEGFYLIGNGGTLFMAKWCLGFLTMFVFASIIYLTGKHKKINWIYIITGIIILHIINIIRLSVLFIYVQNHDSESAENHHLIYNIIVYLLIFVLWVIFFEKYAGIKASRNINSNLNDHSDNS